MAVTNPPIGGPAAPASPFVPQRHGSHRGMMAALAVAMIAVAVMAYMLVGNSGNTTAPVNSSTAEAATSTKPTPLVTITGVEPYVGGKLNPATITTDPVQFMTKWFAGITSAYAACNADLLKPYIDDSDALYSNIASEVKKCTTGYNPLVTKAGTDWAEGRDGPIVYFYFTFPKNTSTNETLFRGWKFLPIDGQWKATSKLN